jgi:hypothetical protein
LPILTDFYLIQEIFIGQQIDWKEYNKANIPQSKEESRNSVAEKKRPLPQADQPQEVQLPEVKRSAKING